MRGFHTTWATVLAIACIAAGSIVAGCSDDITNITEEGDDITNVLGEDRSTEITVNDSELLRDALNVAFPGDTIRILSGTYEGPFLVPGGLTIEGAGRGDTVIAGVGDTPALTLAPGARAIDISALTVEADGAFAVEAAGPGRVHISNVDVRVLRGAGILAEGVSSIALTNVDVTGAVTADNASDHPFEMTLRNATTHGVVITDVPNATLTNVSVSGMAVAGVVLTNSRSAWDGGESVGNLGGNLFVSGGTATVTGVRLCGALSGVSLAPAYGAAFVRDAQVTVDSIEACDNEGIGILQAGAEVTYVDIMGGGNERAAVWIQDSANAVIDGGELMGNHGAGVVAIGSSGILIDGATIADTMATTMVAGDSPVDVGDGIQLTAVTGTTLSNLDLSGNARVGLLIDVGDDAFDIELDAVSVSGEGEELGAIAQGAELPEEWDANVSRDEALATNDEAFEGTLQPLDMFVSSELPSPAAGIR